MKCPNKSHPDWKALVEKVGVVDAYLHYFNNGQEIPDPDNIQETFKGVRAGMKLLDVMTTDKGVSLFNRFFKNNPEKFYKEMIPLMGREQTDLLRMTIDDNGLSTIEEIVDYAFYELAYTLDIDRSTYPNITTNYGNERFKINDSEYYTEWPTSYNKMTEQKYGRDGYGITAEEYNNARKIAEKLPRENSAYYFGMVTEGGTNYAEHVVAVPGIDLSGRMEAHFENMPDNIGWFRSDEKEFDNSVRRVLEIQSDLFQKNKNETDLSPNKFDNKFLNSISKNWETLFIKSIIQDSVRKGYNKVQFPTNHTVIEIEKYDNLEDEIEGYKTEIAKLEKDLEKAYDDNASYDTIREIQRELNLTKRDLKYSYASTDSLDNPVVKFYREKIANILNKQFPNRVMPIIDEYGNMWNEVTLADEDRSEFYFQRNADSINRRNKELEDVIKKFFAVNKIDYKSVSEIINPTTGEKMSAVAIADMMNKVVRVIESKAGIDTLPEEASHFLVELLGENHPLYKSMYSEVEKYDIYQDVLREYSDIYKNDTAKLKKEAIGKIIARKLLGQEIESIEANESRLNRWFNKVLSFIRDKVRSLIGMDEVNRSFMDADPFSEAASLIMKETAFSDGISSNDYFLQTESQSQSDIVKRIEEKHIITKDADGYILHDNGKEHRVKNRVTNRVKRFMDRTFGNKDVTESEKRFATVTAEYGTKGHDDIENIVQRAVAKRDGTVSPAKTYNLPEVLYNELERYFNDFVSKIPASSKILTEVKIYDPNADEAGTIDMLIIDEDGTASIYDYKFIAFGKQKEIKWYKSQAINIQMERYKGMLTKEYGIEKFKNIRAIPIEARYKGEKLEAIKLGSADVVEVVEGQEHLQQLPIFQEMTGDKGLDRILLSLLADKKKLNDSRPPVGSSIEDRELFISKKNIELARIQKAIRDIQLRHDLGEYINIGKSLNEKLRGSDLSEYDNTELAEMVDTKLKFYGKELIETLSGSLGDEFSEFYKDLSSLAAEANILSNRLNQEIARRVEESQPELLTPQRKIGFWGKNFRTFFNQDNPVISAFSRLIQRANDLYKREYDEINEQVVDSVAKLRKEGIANFDWMIRTLKNGRKRIVPKYSQEFYDTLAEKRSILTSKTTTKEEKSNAAQFIRNNFDFDVQKYQDKLNAFVKGLDELQSKQGFSDEIKGSRILNFENQYSNNNLGLANKNNFYLKLKDRPENYSQEYKDIQANPAKKEFYDLWMKYSGRYQEYIGQHKDLNFVWNVPLKMLEGVIENGFGHIINKRAWLDYYQAQQYEYFANVDPETQEVVYQVPKMFHRENTITDEAGNVTYDTSLQSTDLGKVLLTVAGMAINHKNMLEIESNTLFLKHIMAKSESYVTDKFGNLVKDDITGKLVTQADNSSNHETFKQYMEYYLYGKKIQHNDVKVFGLSSIALYKSASSYFRSKALALNPLSIVANTVGGNFNAVMLGASRRFFKARDYIRASKLLAQGGEKVNGLRKFFDIEEGNNYALRTNKASMSTINKLLDKDHLYIGQRFADWQTRQSLLFAMLQQFRVVDGKVQNLNEENKEAPTLFEYAEVKDGELTFKDVSSEELDKFRNKVLKVTDSVLGTGINNDVRLASTNVFMDMLLMFRSWLPRTFDVRWGELREDKVLDEWELGRYRSFLNELIQGYKDNDGKVVGGILNTVKNLATGFGTFGLGNNIRKSVVEHAKLLYAEAKVKNPTLTLTEEQYIQIHLGNLRASMIELYAMIAMTSMIMLAMPDDDEDKRNMSGGRRFLVNSLNKFQTELLTYISPTEFSNLLKSPVPFFRFASDITNLFKTISLEGVETVTGDDSLTKKNDLRKYWFRIFPVTSGIESLFQYIEDDYNATTDKAPSRARY